MKPRDRDRIVEISKRINLNDLPFEIKKDRLNELFIDISEDLSLTLKTISKSKKLKWCLSTVKKAKVFTIIYLANENGKSIYKEEIAKLLSEYSYKTVATIIDEGMARGYYVELDPVDKKNSDKKIKNIRPSIDVMLDFYNWNIGRLERASKIIEKFKK
jgi:hypothetical protein